MSLPYHTRQQPLGSLLVIWLSFLRQPAWYIPTSARWAGASWHRRTLIPYFEKNIYVSATAYLWHSICADINSSPLCMIGSQLAKPTKINAPLFIRSILYELSSAVHISNLKMTKPLPVRGGYTNSSPAFVIRAEAIAPVCIANV